MKRRTARACIGLPGEPCGKITTNGSRCPLHDAAYRTAHSARKRDPQLDSAAHRNLSARTIAAWVRENGWLCPGWGRKPHPSRDLTLDHRIPRAAHGATDPTNAGVLCRSCNGRKGAALQEPVGDNEQPATAGHTP